MPWTLLSLEPRTKQRDPIIYGLSLSAKCFVSFCFLAVGHNVHTFPNGFRTVSILFPQFKQLKHACVVKDVGIWAKSCTTNTRANQYNFAT